MLSEPLLEGSRLEGARLLDWSLRAFVCCAFAEFFFEHRQRRGFLMLGFLVDGNSDDIPVFI